MDFKTVWERRTRFGTGNRSEAVTRVDVNSGGGVTIQAYTIGPRGGAGTGWPGFSAAEWDADTAAVAAARVDLGGGPKDKGSSGEGAR